MKKKGFTLVELLAVIAILAILVIIALPNVMGMFNTAKESSFTTELKQIYKVAQQQWMSDSMFTTGEKVYTRCNGCNGEELNLSGRTELEYYIKIDQSGKVVEFYATDGTYQFAYEGDLLATNINGVEQVANLDKEDVFKIDNNGIVRYERIPDDDDCLMAGSDGRYTSTFLRTIIDRDDIESLTFSNKITGHVINGTTCFDVSKGNNGSVTAWITDNDSNGLYEMTIAAKGKVYASSGKYLFSNMSELKTINGMQYFNTSKITNTTNMFNACNNLQSLDLSYFDTSNVTNMEAMFNYCDSLITLDISSFDMSKVTAVTTMFRYSRNLKTIYVGDNFNDLSNINYSASMFENCPALVGGAGTVFNSQYIDKSYAHIDGGVSNPGYFTRK